MVGFNKLQGIFNIMEIAAFQEWKAASPKRREEITEKIGRLQAKMIIEEIESQAQHESHAR